MKRQKRKEAGITLIALVISIIVMLILAGVSINATVGDNGILKQAMDSSVMSKFSGYQEEFEMNKSGTMMELNIFDDLNLNYLGTDEEFKKFVPSIDDNDRSKFEIIGGYLAYTGSDVHEEELALKVGISSKFDPKLYAVIGEEFQKYIEAVLEAKNSGKYNSIFALREASFDQINSMLPDDKKIPEKYKDLFVLRSGVLTYLGTDEDKLRQLAQSEELIKYIRPPEGDPSFYLANYVSPLEATVKEETSENGKKVYKVKDGDNNIYTIRIEETLTGSNRYNGIITRYEGKGGTITIPDEFNIGTLGTVFIIGLEGKGQGSGTSRTYVRNIFVQDDNTTSTLSSDLVQVILAKGIYKISDYALANLGSNKPFTILHDGEDLNFDEGTGIEGSCGSYTFVAPSAGTYLLKCWGASGAGWDKVTAENKNWGSLAGYGGYSEGTVELNQGDKLYINIGGKGLAPFEAIPDVSLGTSNGTGGYNGGGNFPYKNSALYNTGGGGCTDIRFIDSTYDGQILVAGGGRWM